MAKQKIKICSACENQFSCGDSVSGKSCWCNDFPPIFELETGGDCLCPTCFKQSCLYRIEQFVAETTPETAVNNKAALLPKSTNLIPDLDYYVENGNYVFTSWYHLKRGYCCQNGCRHCPY
ncbi:DUF5522 domain-containing protein [Flavobacterium agrisoli]|uniref:Cysteine-rich CWC n=1 Tax=Flavobacterium agrisoli TaxID=2793066 RepID=A0A934PRE7_9FLAO|nr:DUF5522 domain-containing protein [Flavobacterium agrisoli]MBK0371211.1 hypothetical protein [Flavobacterium agrisoli]